MVLTDEMLNKLKGQGFILNRNKETFSLRIVTGYGVVTPQFLHTVADAAEKFGCRLIGLTSRLGFELTGIRPEDADAVEKYLSERGILTGGTGPRIRPIVACKGAVCRFGLHDTWALGQKLHERFYIGWHDVALPAKFKIGVGGCPNNCIKPQLNDFSVVGAAAGEKCVKIFIGGKYGRKWRQGDELGGLYSHDESLEILEKALHYYKDNANPKERFGDMIDRLGLETVRKALLG